MGQKLQNSTEQIAQSLRVYLYSLIGGGIAVVSSLASATFGVLLLGGGIIGGGKYWFQRKKKQLKERFQSELERVQENFEERIRGEIEGKVLEQFLLEQLRSWRDKITQLEREMRKFEEIREQFFTLGKLLEG